MADGLTQHQHREESHLETCQKTRKLQVQNRRSFCLQETKFMRHICQFTLMIKTDRIYVISNNEKNINGAFSF
jgi:hypothetical protein